MLETQEDQRASHLQHDRVPDATEVRSQAPPLGLTQEYPNPEDKEATSKTFIDVIALHGLVPKSEDVHWLKDSSMLPSVIPDCRILSYNWNANYIGDTSKINLIREADTLLDRIHIERKKKERSDYPIIFIASCFGGLLLAKTLARASEIFHPIGTDNYRRILDLTVGVAFLSTPFKGSWDFGYAHAQTIIRYAEEENIESSQELVQYLRPDSHSDAENAPSPLDETVQRFTELVNHDRSKLPVACFYEVELTKYNSYLKKLPENSEPGSYDSTGQGVPIIEASASIDGCWRVAIYRRHSMMTKYNSPTYGGFVRISQSIRTFAVNADDTLSKRAYQYQFTTLSHPSVEYLEAKDFSVEQRENYEKCEPQTCRSLLESTQLSDWKKSSRSSTLFCPGMPGAGKTVFASAVIEYLSRLTSNDRKSTLAYVYCDYVKDKREDPVQTSGYFLKSLLKQLMRASTVIPEQVLKMIDDLKRSNSQPTEDQVEKAIIQVAERFSHVFIVIDALDECRRSEAKKLMDALSRIQTSQTVHLMVTARLINEIRGQFLNRHQLPFIFIDEYHLPIKASQGDIALYVRNHISDVTDILSNHVEFKEEVVQVVSRYSEGMFLLAHLHLRLLQGNLTVKQIRNTLNGIRICNDDPQRSRSEADMMKLLTDAYDRTLTMINSRPRGFSELARKAFMWVAFSFEPFTEAQLQEALAIEIGANSIDTNPENLYAFRDISKACAGLLRLDDYDNVRLLHSTTEAYIRENIDRVGVGISKPVNLPAADSFSKVAQPERRSHRSLALSCVTYLICARFGNVNGHDDFVDPSALLEYGRLSWAKHAAYIQFKSDEEALSLVTKLTNEKTKIYALLRPHATFAIENLTEGAISLHYFITCGLQELVEISLSGNIRDTRNMLSSSCSSGFTPLCRALNQRRHGSKFNLVKLLLEKGADAEHITSLGPPLVLAAEDCDTLTVELLLRKTLLGIVDLFFIWIKKRDNDKIKWLVEHTRVDLSQPCRWAHLHVDCPENRSPLEEAREGGDDHIKRMLDEAKERYDADVLDSATRSRRRKGTSWLKSIVSRRNLGGSERT